MISEIVTEVFVSEDKLHWARNKDRGKLETSKSRCWKLVKVNYKRKPKGTNGSKTSILEDSCGINKSGCELEHDLKWNKDWPKKSRTENISTF